MDRFEYKIVRFRPPTTLSEKKSFNIIEEQLNKYGNEGWELCCINGYSLYFKRKICD